MEHLEVGVPGVAEAVDELVPIVARAEGQQLPERDLAIRGVLEIPVLREPGEDRLLEVFDQPLVPGDTRKRRRDALGDRSHVVERLPVEVPLHGLQRRGLQVGARPVLLEDQPAGSHHEDRMDPVSGSGGEEVEKLLHRRLIHANVGQGRRMPAVRRLLRHPVPSVGARGGVARGRPTAEEERGCRPHPMTVLHDPSHSPRRRPGQRSGSHTTVCGLDYRGVAGASQRGSFSRN
jgi:hypothetical protein